MEQPFDKEEEIKIDDIRMMRPGAVFEKSTSTRVTFQQTENIEIKKCEFSFYAPNVVSLFLSVSDKELQKALQLYKEIFEKKLNPKQKYELPTNQISKLYDYLEIIQSSIITMYTAVEAFANIAIPEDYIENKVNSKGITEIWNKKAIERWYSTSEKIGNLLPSILKIESPKQKDFWSSFKKLEEIRNNIIHPKASKQKLQAIESNYLQDLFQDEIFEIIKSGFKLIKFYCDHDEAHNYYPVGIGKTVVKPIEVDKFSEYFVILPKK